MTAFPITRSHSISSSSDLSRGMDGGTPTKTQKGSHDTDHIDPVHSSGSSKKQSQPSLLAHSFTDVSICENQSLGWLRFISDLKSAT